MKWAQEFFNWQFLLSFIDIFIWYQKKTAYKKKEQLFFSKLPLISLLRLFNFCTFLSV